MDIFKKIYRTIKKIIIFIVDTFNQIIYKLKVYLGIYDENEELSYYTEQKLITKELARRAKNIDLNKNDYVAIREPMPSDLYERFKIEDFIKERFFADIAPYKIKTVFKKKIMEEMYAESRIGRIDFYTPMVKFLTLKELSIWFILASVVFYMTDCHKGVNFDYGNYLDDENEFNNIKEKVVGSSDDTEDEYKFDGFRVSSAWFDWIEPRAIIYQGCELYIQKCITAKDLYCDTYNLDYNSDWFPTLKDYKSQKNPINFSLYTAHPSPQVVMTWFNKNDRYKLVKIFQNAFHLKAINFNKKEITLEDEFKMELTNENLFFINKYLEPKILELNDFMKQLKHFFLKKDKTKIESLKTLLFWQKKWYNIVETLDPKFHNDEDQKRKHREIEKYNTNYSEIGHLYPLYKIRALTRLYIALYKRDIVFWKAKEEYCLYTKSPMTPIKKMALGDITFPNKAFKIWQKYKDGNFIPKEGFLRVPFLKSHLTIDTPDDFYSPNPKKPFEPLKIYNFKPTDDGYRLQRVRFEDYYTKLTKLELRRTNKLYGKSSFALEFERVIQPMTHQQQDEILIKKYQAEIEMKKTGISLMPEGAFALKDDLKKKNQKEKKVKEKLKKKLNEETAFFDFETDDELLDLFYEPKKPKKKTNKE